MFDLSTFPAITAVFAVVAWACEMVTKSPVAWFNVTTLYRSCTLERELATVAFLEPFTCMTLITPVPVSKLL